MTEQSTGNDVCIIIGASHGGVNLAFALRKEGWEGEIHLIDQDPNPPYHRPPLSKAHLTTDDGLEKILLKAPKAYEDNNIQLHLGHTVTAIDHVHQQINLEDGSSKKYDKLVLAVGARPIIPPIKGIDDVQHLYPMRTADDVNKIRSAFKQSTEKRVVIIGGGYIGLETAASLKKLGGEVTVLEREERILARVTAPVMSEFFHKLHTDNGVDIHTGKNVVELRQNTNRQEVVCSDGTVYPADVIVMGVGIRVNQELAEEAGLKIDNGINVNEQCKTSDNNIYAIGDCTYHYNNHYDRWLRLESVQNAVDQAKIAAQALTEKNPKYDALPWFWSDQYDVKLLMVGLSDGYDEILKRDESTDDQHKFSTWYFKGEQLLAVDAVNNAKAYVVGTKLIGAKKPVNKQVLSDPEQDLKALL
ncbi:FAD-dependent oxidoreductase [Gilvimarinus agarilyticus]|uniref:NAD(P)/FAD-dependent oxidoreductase n=1 Tax=Gilvimarinus sp. 2_MG-2023 TaxID=3062666 RepID=UPI001C0A5F51|nr:FAD-dependent oxidoreductase [Gilvimarinus sp. 2_MG-2023]MBU2887694.1 FAD-dependent oxidoreductase [Gilvimarinus agarilyticus]MDO6572342.1 FAD-dependent oxidoreductase [Gilvimarinus sp. 2_MG-2023]